MFLSLSLSLFLVYILLYHHKYHVYVFCYHVTCVYPPVFPQWLFVFWCDQGVYPLHSLLFCVSRPRWFSHVTSPILSAVVPYASADSCYHFMELLEHLLWKLHITHFKHSTLYMSSAIRHSSLSLISFLRICHTSPSFSISIFRTLLAHPRVFSLWHVLIWSTASILSAVVFMFLRL